MKNLVKNERGGKFKSFKELNIYFGTNPIQELAINQSTNDHTINDLPKVKSIFW